MYRIPRLKEHDNRLKTCQFCGSKVEMVNSLMYIVRCTNKDCGADIVFSDCERDDEKTLAHFNRRTEK